MEKRSKKNAVKWGIITAACLLVAAFIVGVCLQTFGTGKAKPSEWFDSGKQEELTVGGGMVLPDNEKPMQGGNGISLYSAEIPVEAYAENGVSEDAENAYTVTATVSPDNDAQNTVVIWALTWKDPSSAWATGKALSDYITATPNGEGVAASKTVTVVCLQAFGEPVVLTAKCKYDETVTVSVQIDYAARLNLSEYVATNLTDALGESYSIAWNGETVIPFEFGTVDQVLNLYPTRISINTVGDFTVTDSYTVTLSQETGGAFPADTAAVSLTEPQTRELGTIAVNHEQTTMTITVTDTDGASDAFTMARLKIGKYMVGSLDRRLSELPSFSGRDVAAFNAGLIDGNIHLCNIVLTIAGTSKSYEFRTKVMVNKGMWNANLSGVTLDESNLIF